VQHLGGFFHQIFTSLSAPANRKKGFYTNRVPKKQELEAFIYIAAQNFELFSNIQNQNLKIKTYRSLCPFSGLSNDTTLRPGLALKNPPKKTHPKNPKKPHKFKIFYEKNTNFFLSNRFFMNK
jgi:hypothetical protein